MEDIHCSTDDEKIAANYFKSINNMFGLVAFSLCLTILQFDKPELLAWVAFFVFVLLAYEQGHEYKKVLQRSNAESRCGLRFLALFFRRCWLFFLAMAFIGAIAVGLITNKMFM